MGAILCCSAQASHGGSFPCCEAQALGVQASVVVCGTWGQLLRGMWDLPRPGIEPMSPALAGGFQSTVPPGKLSASFLKVIFSSVQFTYSVVSDCDPMDCSTPGFPIHHQLPELTQTHVYQVMMPSNHLIPVSSCFQSFPAAGSFAMSQLFTSGGQSIGVSASTLVLPMNIRD